MRHVHGISVVVCALTLAACGGPAPTVIEDTGLTASVFTGELGALVVRGDVSTIAGTGLRLMTIDAVKTPSGEVKGQYRVELTATGLFFEVDVSCMSADDNTAWVAGHITATNAATIQVGSVSYQYITDNGKPLPNHDVTPDVISTARINDAAGRDVVFCTDLPRVLPILNGLQGDVSVR